MTDPASASRENGKLGGRPKSLATIRTQKAREYISEQLERDLPAIYSSLAAKALDGDTQAAKELFDRGYGKAAQIVVTEDEEGNQKPMFVAGFNYITPNGTEPNNN